MGELRGGVNWASDIFCHGQKRDYLSRASQRARGATKKKTKLWKAKYIARSARLPSGIKNVEFCTSAVIISTSDGSHVMLSQHLFKLIVSFSVKNKKTAKTDQAAISQVHEITDNLINAVRSNAAAAAQCCRVRLYNTDQKLSAVVQENKKHLKNVGPIHHCEPPNAHSPDVASGTVARRLRIDVHDNADNDNA